MRVVDEPIGRPRTLRFEQKTRIDFAIRELVNLGAGDEANESLCRRRFAVREEERVVLLVESAKRQVRCERENALLETSLTHLPASVGNRGVLTHPMVPP